MPDVLPFARLKRQGTRFVAPHIRTYNRLETNPRSSNFDQSLSMACHDPMWFLCRQWQFGEFEGEDAGTPAQARVLGVHSQPKEIGMADGATVPFDTDEALETYVEKELLQPTLFLRAQMGRQFCLLLSRARLKRYTKVFAEAVPLDRVVADDDPDGQALSLSLGQHLPDGFRLFEIMTRNEFVDLYTTLADIENEDHDALAEIEVQFFNWYVTLYSQPIDTESAWSASRLEYQFSLNARNDGPGTRKLIADQYPGGRLDWPAFDQTTERRRRPRGELANDNAVPQRVVQTFLPTPLKFSGMPHPRLWQMEEGEVNFGRISASPTSLLNVLLAQFGLTYSNDWFVLPYELETNTLCDIKTIVVTDVFGQNLAVRPAIEDPESNWQQFAMFHQTERDNATTGESRFYLAPAIGQRLESEDIERINLIRDEMSNLVWGIEQVVASDAGSGRLLKRELPSLDQFEPADDVSNIRYVLGNTVPDNWIPFVPAHARGSEREIRLQRAKLPNSRGPQGKILSEVQPVYFIEEEEVPRAGVLVSRRFQRTRWLGGKTLLWMGRRKQTGLGEGIANLVFDSIRDIDR
ncbi:MAG: hypothetical protein AAGL69_16435 [Pseudomonadota bacterium]